MKFPGSYDRIPLSDVICSVCHFRYFTEHADFRALIKSDADFIAKHGLQAYLEREYLSRRDGKAIILNDIGGEINCVDGNRHIAAILSAVPGAAVGQLKEVIRFWREGREYIAEDRLNSEVYSVYIPCDADTQMLTNNNIPVEIIRDCFKPDRPLTKVIPANISFSDSRFRAEDRGCKFSELTAKLV